MCRNARCRLFLILSILVVSSAPAAVAAESLCAAPIYLPPAGTRAVLDGFSTQAAVFRPQDVDPARSRLRPTSCTNNNWQYQSARYHETGETCHDGAVKVAADADAEAQNACCNLGGSVWYESLLVDATCIGCIPPGYCVSGFIYYKCTSCDPPIC
jgi:hypothetical protein